MPIKEVTMYRAVCDVCGVGNHDSEYYAWTEADQARSEWDDDGYGVALDDGRLFCGKCIPADVCRLSDDRSGKHSPSDDGLSCVECPKPNHHGVVDEEWSDGHLLITFDDGGAAPYPPDMVRHLMTGPTGDH